MGRPGRADDPSEAPYSGLSGRPELALEWPRKGNATGIGIVTRTGDNTASLRAEAELLVEEADQLILPHAIP